MPANAKAASLNLDDDSAFLRGIERADAPTVDRFIAALTAMRQTCRYSNQDVDRRMSARSALNDLRTIGNTPILTHDQMLAQIAAERNAQFQAAEGR